MWGPILIGLRHFHWRFKAPVSPDIAREIPYVPALGLRGQAQGFRFYTYQLLEWEGWTVRSPIDWAGRSISDLFELERLRPRHEYNGIIFGEGVKLQDVIRRFVDRVDDPRLNEIKAILGPKSTQDAFHLFVCEEQGVDGLITLDLRLRRKFEQAKKRLKSPVSVLLPSEACKLARIEPVGPEWFGASNAEMRRNSIVQLFQRRANWKDRLAFAFYRGLIYLRDRRGLKVRFVLHDY